MAMNGKKLIHTVHCNKCNTVLSGADIGKCEIPIFVGNYEL